MSFSIDVNVLVYAVDSASPLHDQAKSFLEEKLNSSEKCFVCQEVLHGFFRTTTHPGIFKTPFSQKEAVEIVERLEANHRVEFLSSNSESLRILKSLIVELKLRGAVISDAVIASILQANGIKTIFTHDRDFWKFSFLKPIDPFSKRKG